MQGERFGDLFSDFSMPNTVGFNANRKLGLITDKLIKHMLIDLDDIQKSFYHLSSFSYQLFSMKRRGFICAPLGQRERVLDLTFVVLGS